MTNPTILGGLALSPTLDTTQLWAEFRRLGQEMEREQGVKLRLNTGEVLTSLSRVKQDIAELGSLSGKQTTEQTRAARVLTAQYKANAEAVREHNAAVLAGHRSQSAASKAEAAEAQARTARIREQMAQQRLTLQLTNQVAREEKQRVTASLSALENESRAYRAMWRARQLSDDQVIEHQRRIYQQALLQAQAVDKQSEAYRRLAQVMATAQGTVDNAQGFNTPGGLGANVSQGILQALGNLGPFGQVLEQSITAAMNAAQEAAREGSRDVARETGEGLRRGLAAERNDVKRAAVNTAKAVQDGAEEALDIHSPSRVMHRVGEFAGEGLADGLLSKRAEVAAAARSLANAAEQNATPHLAPGGVSGGGMGGALPPVAVMPSAQAGLKGVATQAALTTAAVGGTALAVGGLAMAFTNGVQKAAGFEAQLDSSKVSVGATAEEMKRLEAASLTMGAGLGFTATQAAAGIEELGSQGLNVTQVLNGGLISSMNLARATTGSLTQAAEINAGALRAWKMEASELPDVADVISAAVNNTSLRMDNLRDGIAAGGSMAKSFGLDFREYIATLSLGTDAMLSASDAGTGLKTMFMALTPNSKEAAAIMRELKFSAFDANGEFIGLEAVIQKLTDATRDLTPEQRSMKLETLFGADAVRLINILIDNGAEGLRKRTELLNRTGEATRSAAEKMNNARGAQLEWNRATERFQISWAQGVLPVLTQGLNVVTELVDKWAAMNEEMGESDTPREIKATLKIDWANDDATTVAYKLFAGGLVGLGEIADSRVGNAVQNAMNPARALAQVAPALFATYSKVQQRQTAIDLREQLVGAGLMERSAKNYVRQIDAIMADYARYLKMYTDIVEQGARALGKTAGSPAPLAGQGPLMPGQTRTTDVTGMAIVAGAGMAGRTRGTPYNQTYGPNGSWGRHVGEDFFAPVGTPVYAPFSGYASVRHDKAQGNIVDLFDAAGKRLTMIHLEKYADGLVAAIDKAGGRLLVKQGQLLATVGQSGDSAHKELGSKNSHLHLHATNAAGQIVDPFGQTYQGVTAGTPWTPQNTSGTAAGFAAKPFESYVKEAQRLTDAVAKYAPGGAAPNADRWRAATTQLDKFRDSNDLAAQAVQWVGLETGKSKTAVSEYGQTFDRLKGQLDITASLDNLGRPAADITSRLDTIRQQALAGAEAEKKRWGETAKYKALLDLAGDAAKKLEQIRNRKADLTPLQREQQQQQDAVAQQRMEASLRASSAKRLQQLVDGGVTPEVSLAKWQAAQAEIKRRQDAQDKDDKKREEDRKVAGQNRLAAERALADGQFELADRTAGLVIKTYDRQVKGAGDSAAARLDIEERLGADVLAARETQARVAAQQEKTRLERERNTAVNATGLTLSQRQKLWNQYGDKIQQVDADLAETIIGIQDDATRQMADLQQRAFAEENVGKAEAYADRLRATIESLPGQDEEGLLAIYSEARANRDQELLKAVYEEWERRRLDEEAGQHVIFEMQAQANTVLAEGARKVADELAAAGDSDGALATLETALDGVMDAAQRGEDAADAINLLTDAINGLTGNTALMDEFNTFVAGLSGTIDEQIGQVVGRLEEVTDPAMRAKLQGLLKDLRADLPKYADPYAAGYVPGTNGFVNSGDAPNLEEVAKARDLGTLLNETTDPAQVQALMGEVVDLLASEIGQRLPDSIRTGLEESVKGAQGYLDALAQITEDGVVDGWERAAKGALANPLPTNRFSDFSNQIFSMGADGLSDPTQYDALTTSLQNARAASQLTEADLQNLLALIEELRNPKTPDVGKAFDLNQWQQDIQTLTDDFDSGRMTAGEYSSGLRDAAVQLNDLADEAERMGNLKLAGQFRELAGSLRAMTPEIAGLLQGLGKVQEYAGYVQDLAGAFSALAEGVGNDDLAANLNGLGNLAGKVAALAGDVMRIIANPADIGAWVGAITKVVSAIGEALNGHRKAYEQAAKMREDFNKRFTLIDGNDFAKTTVRSRGWLADTFGGGPEVKQVVDEFGLKIAQAIEGGVMGGIKNGMKQALTTGDWTNFRNTFRESAYSGVVDGLIEAIFNEALKDILAPGIKALTDAAKTPGTEDDAAAIAAFEAGIVAAEQFLTTAGQAVQPSLDRLRNNLGITTPSNTGGVDTTGLSTLPEPIQFALATPLLDGVRGIKDAAGVLMEGAVIIRDTFKDGVKVTVQQGGSSYTSTTGALV